MNKARPLPSYLVQRYHGWNATTFSENKSWYRRLADEGQRPRSMIISCCDSRVHVTQMFGADQGEIFLHRNIANLVPPFAPDGDYHGTSAAVEYAVTALKVSHLIVLGHSKCGGVKGFHEKCLGNAPELSENTSFVGRWIDILKPGYERLGGNDAEIDDNTLEKEGVLVSLENLMTFPFIQDAVESEQLTLHGLWTDIGAGGLEFFNAETGAFEAL